MLSSSSPLRTINEAGRAAGVGSVGSHSPIATGPRNGNTKEDIIREVNLRLVRSTSDSQGAAATGGGSPAAASPVSSSLRSSKIRKPPPSSSPAVVTADEVITKEEFLGFQADAQARQADAQARQHVLEQLAFRLESRV